MKGIYFATRNAMNTCSFAARLIVKYRYLKLSSIAQSDPEYKQNLQ